MPKIMLVTRSFPPVTGGIENFMYNIYSRLSGDIFVVAPFEQDCSNFDEKQNLSICRTARMLNIMKREKMAIFPLFLTAVRKLLFQKIEQIHCDQTQSGIIGYLFKKFFSIPYVVYAYGMEITGGKLHRLKSIVLRNADRVIAISNFTRSELIKNMKVEGSRVVIIHPCVDTLRFNPKIECTDVIKRYELGNKKIILTVGRLSGKEGYKGHDMVIKALPKVSSQIPNILYLVVGSGSDMERLQGLVQELGLEDKVIFAGYVPEEELPKYYNACELFIMPSRERKEGDGKGKKVEGFGIVFLEANACGKPVIGGRSGGIEDAVIDGVTGLLVDPNSVDEVAGTIIRILMDSTLAQRLAEQGRERAINELSWERAAAEVGDVIGGL
jgi:phosphatidylinositol alpha-1,6-mannosyltransferase